MNTLELKEALLSDNAKDTFTLLYGTNDTIYRSQIRRYTKSIDQFVSIFDHSDDLQLFSAPGRTEIGGNHTDHNLGRVLAGSVDLDAIAIVQKVKSPIITIKSEGYDLIKIDTTQLDVIEAEKFTTTALIRGVCARIKELGYSIGGYNAYITSNVLKGSGLSSSAAFEVLLVSITNHLYCQGQIDDILNAQISKYAENVYFGKPSGLMDQMACAIGGIISIDFLDNDNPIVEKINFDLAKNSLSLVITDTGGDHSALNEEYASINQEMRQVASVFGKDVLRQVSYIDIIDNIGILREKTNDRAILRAMHYFNDNEIVLAQKEALNANNTKTFMQLVEQSGISSWTHLQNCYTTSNPTYQSVTLALSLAKQFLQDKGVCRVHGGGFAGTIQAFVQKDYADEYIQKMSEIFGFSSCYKLTIRQVGVCKLEIQ